MTFYFFKNKKILRGIKLLDACLLHFKKEQPKKGPVQKILLSNIAHLGDLIMATAVLPVLKQAFPDAQIGFVIGSWNQEVLAKHPLVHRIYFFDHMKLNRLDKGVFKKIWRHFITRYRTLRALRLERYDVAIDLYYYFPNAAVLFWQAHIPLRFGYTSGGLGPLFTTGFDCQEQNHHISKYYLPLLEALGVNQEALKELRMVLPNQKLAPQEYVVIHMGTGHILKEWEEAKWERLIQLFSKQGIQLVFTGKGEREKKRIERWMPDSGINLCDKLSFSELVDCVQQAQLVIAPDTGIVHIAAALNIPTLALFSSQVNPSQYIQDEKITLKMALSDSADLVYKRACENINR